MTVNPVIVQALKAALPAPPIEQRDFLAEALAIASGELARCAEVRHLQAMAAHIADLRAGVAARGRLLAEVTGGLVAECAPGEVAS
jgi:hypothetical protein